MSEKFHIQSLPLSSVARMSLAAVAVVAAGGTAAQWLAGPVGGGSAVMAVSLAAALVVGLAALAPLLWANGDPANRLVPACVLMMAGRVVLMAAAVAVVVPALQASLQAVLVWMLAGYLSLLGAEVVSLVRGLRREEAVWGDRKEPAS